MGGKFALGEYVYIFKHASGDIITTVIVWYEAAIESFQWMYMYPDVLQRQRRYSMGFCNFKRKSKVIGH